MSSPQRENRRKRFLTEGGIGYTILGLSYLFEVTPGRRAAFEWIPLGWTPDSLGWVWVVGGLLTIVAAMNLERFPVAQTIGFTLLAICPTAWAAVFIGASLTGAYPPGWVSAVIYTLLVRWSLTAAGWDNPRPDAPPTGQQPVVTKEVTGE